MTVKVQLREIRTARKISQNELARLLEMSLANVQKIEYGKAKSIPLDTLDKLCKVLKCKPGDILHFIPDDEEDVVDKQDDIEVLEQSSKSVQDKPSHRRNNTQSFLIVVPELPESA